MTIARVDMANDNTHNCCHHDREQIEISEGVRPMAVLVDEDGCGCECSEVELHTAKEPDILLFEEYCEEYADDIVLAKEAAIAAKEAVETNSAIIIEKENLILDDLQTIKRELREGIVRILDFTASVRDAILAYLAQMWNDIKSRIDSKTTEIKNHISDKYDLLHSDVVNSRDAVLGSIDTAKTAIEGDVASGVQAIKDKIDAGTTTLGGSISSGVTTLQGNISTGVTTLQGNVSTAKQEILNKIDAMSFPTLEACTDQEVLDMFVREESES